MRRALLRAAAALLAGRTVTRAIYLCLQPFNSILLRYRQLLHRKSDAITFRFAGVTLERILPQVDASGFVTVAVKRTTNLSPASTRSPRSVVSKVP